MLYSYKDCVERYGTKYLLKKAVESGEIYQLERGIYSDKKYVSEEYIVAAKYPRAIFTMDSAFYHYRLTDVIPEQYILATDRDASKISDKRIIQVFEHKRILMVGAVTEINDGCKINIYSKERLLIELLRHKSKIPFDYYKEVLLNYRQIIYDLDIRAIQDYAELVPKSSIIMERLRSEVL